MIILGIETSCDDTGIAVVRNGHEILANLVSSQPEHARFGGVVPEIAARKHVEVLPAMLDAALASADVTLDDLDGVAVTRGPGLIGALLAGWCFGRGLAQARGLPYVGVIVSGGHTALYRVTAASTFVPLGKTRDDAAGEAFDKVAKLLELGYPGGPIIDQLAPDGDPRAWRLPRSDLGLDFTFSGLKTAVRRLAIEEKIEPGNAADPNRDLRARFADLAERQRLPLFVSPPPLATDNGAMIAGAGHRRISMGESDPLALAARATWPLGS